MTKTTKLTSSAILVMLIVAGVVYWAAASGASSGVTSDPTGVRNADDPISQGVAAQEHPAATLTTISADQARFSALSASGAGFPSALAGSLSGSPWVAEYGLNLSLARPVATGEGAWLIPGNGELCLWLTDSDGKSGGLVCATTASALTGGLSQSRMNEAGVQHVVGVVPDGTTSVTVAGKAEAIVDNGWEAVTGSATTTAVIASANGTSSVEVP